VDGQLAATNAVCILSVLGLRLEPSRNHTSWSTGNVVTAIHRFCWLTLPHASEIAFGTLPWSPQGFPPLLRRLLLASQLAIYPWQERTH